MKVASNDRAVICGAGIAGLAAAAAVAPHFSEVVIIERDTTPDEPRPRPGVAHSSQSHGLLKRGEAELELLLPGFAARLEAAGGVKVGFARDIGQFDGGAWYPRRDLGLTSYCQSRVLLEQVVRDLVAERFSLTVMENAVVSGVVADDGSVRGVIVDTPDGPDVVEGDFVIDALGRASPASGWLSEAGWPEPTLDVVGIDLRYATVVFDGGDPLPDGLKAYQIGDGQGVSAVFLPLERGRWLVTLGGRFGDYPPKDHDGFLNFARALPVPDVAEQMAARAPLSDVVPYTIRTASRRRYEDAATPWNMISIGEAVVGFDPTFAQGMSVAAAHAGRLAALLRAGGFDATFAERYYEAIAEPSSWAWELVKTVDFAYPGTKGVPPGDLRDRLRLLKASRKAAQVDPDAQRLYTEVRHLLRPMADLRALAAAA